MGKSAIAILILTFFFAVVFSRLLDQINSCRVESNASRWGEKLMLLLLPLLILMILVVPDRTLYNYMALKSICIFITLVRSTDFDDII